MSTHDKSEPTNVIPIRSCAACGKPATGEYTIHRDGLGEGPEVPLCKGCGEGETPAADVIWAMIAGNRA